MCATRQECFRDCCRPASQPARRCMYTPQCVGGGGGEKRIAIYRSRSQPGCYCSSFFVPNSVKNIWHTTNDDGVVEHRQRWPKRGGGGMLCLCTAAVCTAAVAAAAALCRSCSSPLYITSMTSAKGGAAGTEERKHSASFLPAGPSVV